jgi:hypothetical protein
MVRLSLLALAALVFALALAAWAPPASAGTAAAPEITDPAADETFGGAVPIDPVIGSSADIIAGWVTEDADNLFFNIQISGTGADGTLGPYNWNFHVTAGASDVEAGASSSGGGTPAGAATAVTIADSVITLTVPRSVFAGVTDLTAMHIESFGGSPAPDPFDVADLAPDAGPDAGISYHMTGGGSASGNATDSDDDGLNDTWETKEFGNTTAQNGTGDPDGDGLNNSAEFKAGTNATKADTDGDGLNDKADPFPLDPLKPGTAGNGTSNSTADSDHDGLPDSWEKTHFTNLNQTGKGDPDKDGLNNTQEFKLGTDPTKADTDGDGLQDNVDPHPLAKSSDSNKGRPELYTGAAMFAVAATFCLFGLARP